MIYPTDQGFIVNIYKPVEWTSFGVVKKLRGITKIKKIGHAGTLDPFASGVLLIGIARGTKKINELMSLPKTYVAELTLGSKTDSADCDGEFIDQQPVPDLSKQEIEAAMAAFIGQITQKIPKYSAAKINGKRMYKMARAGQEVPDKFKDVTIYSLELLNFSQTKIAFRVVCSRGTYVRTLGENLAEKMGTVGYLTQLERTAIGKYTSENALSIEAFESQWKSMVENENI